MIEQSEQIGQLATALAKAQSEIVNPEFDAKNPHFKNRYATLAAHTDSIRKPLAKFGLSVLQGIGNTAEGGVMVTTRIIHSSGEWMSCSVGMQLPEKATAQALGSLVTYLRRYSLASMGFIVGEPDDDGEEDRQGSRPVFDPSKAKGGKPTNVPAKKPVDFLDESSTSEPQDTALIGDDRAEAICAMLVASNKNPSVLLAQIETLGFNIDNGVAGLPETLLPRIRAWVAKAVAATPQDDSPKSDDSPVAEESKLANLTTRRRAKGG